MQKEKREKRKKKKRKERKKNTMSAAQTGEKDGHGGLAVASPSYVAYTYHRHLHTTYTQHKKPIA